jgi:hypothetical protein
MDFLKYKDRTEMHEKDADPVLVTIDVQIEDARRKINALKKEATRSDPLVRTERPLGENFDATGLIPLCAA